MPAKANMLMAERAKTSNTIPSAQVNGPENCAQLHLRLQYAVAQILAEARSEQEACAGILSTICENLDWQWGAFWIRRGDELRLLGCWRSKQCAAEEFDQISRACVFTEGKGLPGRVWAQRQAIWVSDFSADVAFPRRAIAERCNLHAAIGIPVCGRDFLGVLEFFNHRVLAADADLLQMVNSTGAQIGQFLERKRAEQQLAETQSLFQGVFQGARDAILLANDKGQYVEANPAALGLLGFKREELLNKHVWDVVPMVSEAVPNKAWAKFLTTPGAEGEFTLRRQDGAILDLEYRATTRVIPGVHLLILRDMIGRKQRAQSARFLAAAGAILGEGLDLNATANRVTRVAVPEFADWCVLDLLADNGAIKRAAMAHADPRIETLARQFAKDLTIDPTRAFGSPNVLRTGRTEFLEVTPDILRQAAGKENFILAEKLNLGAAIIAPLKKHGRTFGALSFWRTQSRGGFAAGDSELAEELARRAAWALENARLYEAAQQELELREKLEIELKRLNAALEERIEERTAALQESHSQLESFCYSVSHDLRAPLRSMQGFSHALIEDHSASLNAEGRDFARRILSASEHMDNLLADVLAYSRLSRQQLQLEPVSVDAVVEEARMQFQNEISQRGAEVRIAPSGQSVLANRSVLELMLVNLLENALKFVPKESVPRISVNVESRDSRLRLWVRDNGIGIAPEHQQRIFRIFERLHGVESYPGTGIGLALVQKAAERLNGAIGVESTLGEGSAFWIELPSVQT